MRNDHLSNHRINGNHSHSDHFRPHSFPIPIHHQIDSMHSLLIWSQSPFRRLLLYPFCDGVDAVNRRKVIDVGFDAISWSTISGNTAGALCREQKPAEITFIEFTPNQITDILFPKNIESKHSIFGDANSLKKITAILNSQKIQNEERERNQRMKCSVKLLS